MHRYTSLDILRWVAVLGMIVFHANYLWEYVFDEPPFLESDTFWKIFWYLVGVLFITVSGIVSSLTQLGKSSHTILKKMVQRVGILSLVALGISIITILFFPEQKITWGILHFFALASLIGITTARLWMMNLILGVCLLIGAHWLPEYSDSILLIPLGIPPRDYFSADYYPFIPWFGYYLIGQGIGNILYRYHLLKWLDWNRAGSSFFMFCGRHALIIYILHVPILYGIGRVYFSFW